LLFINFNEFVTSINHREDFLNKLKKGDNVVFGIVYQTYFSRLHNFADEYLHDSDASDDVVQNVFTKLWNCRERLCDNTSLSAWLYTVTKNEALSILEHRLIVYKHRESERERLARLNYQALREARITDESYSDIVSILQKTLEKLSPQCRLVFECSRYKLMSNREIAQYLSISVKTVESHMTRALRILRTALADYM